MQAASGLRRCHPTLTPGSITDTAPCIVGSLSIYLHSTHQAGAGVNLPTFAANADFAPEYVVRVILLLDAQQAGIVVNPEGVLPIQFVPVSFVNV